MKNIEDVIKAYECKKSIEDKCNECPYITECDDKYHCECEARDNDTLHYLKEYRDDRKNFSEAISNCGKALNKYIMDIHALAQQEENLPLTWDELCAMEGKPVWVEAKHFSYPRWYILHAIGDKDMALFTGRYSENVPLFRENMGDTWQAYRKERK